VGEQPLLEAVGDYERQLFTYGTEAVRHSVDMLGQFRGSRGVASNRMISIALTCD
jgi:hypothetical protein